MKPCELRIGGVSAAQIRCRYHGTPSSERSMPNTSHGTAISNGATPWQMTVATVGRFGAGREAISAHPAMRSSHSSSPATGGHCPS